MSISKYIDYDKLFRLEDPLSSRPLRLSKTGYSDWVTSEIAWRIFEGNYFINEPIKLGAFQGGIASDFIWSALIALLCISPRVISLFTENNISGWCPYPIEIFGRKGEIIPNYSGFAVIGGKYKRDRTRSEIITKTPLTPNGQPYQVYKGLYFDEQNWDEKDIFIIRPHRIIVNEKVYSLLKKNKITNVRLTTLKDVEIDVLLDDFGSEY